jgi:hypothetical protein
MIHFWHLQFSDLRGGIPENHFYPIDKPPSMEDIEKLVKVWYGGEPLPIQWFATYCKLRSVTLK